MTYTEEEAKTRWCPFVRFVRLNDAIYSSRGPIIEPGPTPADESPMHCIASGCMAWRFESLQSYESRVEAWEDAANIGGPIVRGPCPEWVGFCGLAGQPNG